MSKPQFAAEPSMEEILSSIRRMISDDKPAPNPIPDQMARTPFGGGSPAAAAPARGSAPVSQLTPSPSFSSLSDALKAATTSTEQRRHLQEEIAEVLDKGPVRGGRPELSTYAPSQGRPETDRPGSKGSPLTGAAPAPTAASTQSLRTALEGLHALPDGGNASPAANGAPQRDFGPMDLGTLVPHREQTGPSAAATKPAVDASASSDMPSAEPQAIELPKSDAPRVVAMPSRAGMNGSTVAPFPRPVRDAAKSAQADAADEKDDRQPVSANHQASTATGAAPAAAPAAQAPSTATAPTAAVKSETLSASTAASEALLDAVVEMVQKQPESLSVFTSGASFISGVVGKPKFADDLAATMSGKSAAPPKMDKAAAELLRPMLRQWLSDNMPRIVEEALRSELMSTQEPEGPGKGSKG